MVKLLICTVMAVMFFCSCSSPTFNVEESKVPTAAINSAQPQESAQEASDEIETKENLEYYEISSVEAQEMMNGEVIILDVRTEEELFEGYIEGSILIPHDEISQYLDKLPEDNDAAILVYCRTGRRSELAAQELANLGYTQVYDMGGIITDWHGDVVKY